MQKILNPNVKQFLTYVAGSLSQTALGFLLLPLYLNRLTPGEYGRVSVLLTFNTIISLLAGSWVLSGLVRLYYEQADHLRHRLAATAILWTTGATLLPATVTFLAASSLSSALFGSPAFAGEVRAATVLLCVTTLPFGLCQVLRLEKRATAFVMVSVFGFLTDLTFKIYLLGVRGLGVEGYFISSILSSVLVVGASVSIMVRGRELTVDRTLLRKLLIFGVPFFFTGIGMWVLDVSDRLILNAFAGSEAVGIYTLACKLASIFNIVLLGPLSLFWSPHLLSIGAEQGEEALRRTCRQFFPLLAVVGGFLLVVIGCGAADLIRLFSRNTAYHESSCLVPFLSLAPFLHIISFPAGSVILQTGQVRYSGYAVAVAAFVNLALNLVLVPRFSFYGATATTVAGYSVLCALQHFWAQRLLRIAYDWGKFVKTAGSSGLAILVAMQIHLEGPVVSLLVREVTGLTIFALAIYVIGGRVSDLKAVPDLTQHDLSRLSAPPQEVSL